MIQINVDNGYLLGTLRRQWMEAKYPCCLSLTSRRLKFEVHLWNGNTYVLRSTHSIRSWKTNVVSRRSHYKQRCEPMDDGDLCWSMNTKVLISTTLSTDIKNVYLHSSFYCIEISNGKLTIHWQHTKKVGIKKTQHHLLSSSFLYHYWTLLQARRCW